MSPTAVRPPRFGSLEMKNEKVVAFNEKNIQMKVGLTVVFLY